MARRQSDVLRNLDTPLQVAGLITIKSLGLVLIYFTVAQALDLMEFWSILFGKWGWFVEHGSVLILALFLMFIERHEDEHLPLQALRYFFDQRIWERSLHLVMPRRQYVYTGLARVHHKPTEIERIFDE